MKDTLQKRIRYFFIILIIGLFTQLYYVFQYKEPFPAIMMPRFSYQAIQDSIINFPKVQIELKFKDSSAVLVSKHELFANIHLPQRNKILKKVFLPSSEISNEETLKIWLMQRVERISGREDLAYMDFNWNTVFWKFGNNKEAIATEFLDRKRIYF